MLVAPKRRPKTNNYRTHKVINEIKLNQISVADPHPIYGATKTEIALKRNINSAPDDVSIPRMYVQDVGNNVPATTISQITTNVNKKS